MHVIEYDARAYMQQTYLDKDIPVAIVIEGIRVQDLELGDITVAVHVFADELLIREGLLGVLVEELHVRVGRRRVKIVIQLLDVLAMVALVASNTKETFLEDRIVSIPQ